MKEKCYCELKELKKLLKRKNLSYRKFSERISISTDALNNKLNGYSCFNSAEISKIAKTLKIEADDIGFYFFPECI